jgi:dTDP-4-amino-4,6-dideoxygalactose transaminase
MSTNVKIPLVDLVTLHQELEEELVAVFKTALRTGGFIGGPMVEGFERDFAEFSGARYCVGVGSGTDAVRFALLAAGVKPGDTVVTVPNTFIATVEAISQTGARADFVDVDERTYTMDPKKLREYLETQCAVHRGPGKLVNRKTARAVTAVVPVHLYGQPADMDAILELAGRYNLIVIEDACQGHGAEYFSKRENRWRKVGSMGQAAAFSFYPGKNLGACGEAGAVTTNGAELAQKVRVLRDHGQARKYHHEMEGYNGRLDAIQAGILRAKLKHLREWNEKRREVAQRYGELFASLQGHIGLPHEPRWAKAVYHLYVIRVENRDELQAYLAKAGIGTGIHYPIPLHLQRACRELGFRKGDLPVSERVAREVLSLPLYPRLEIGQQRHVLQKICEFVLGDPWPALDVHRGLRPADSPNGIVAAASQLSLKGLEDDR